MMGLYFVMGLVILLIIVTIVMYNGIISADNRAKRSWADIVTYERNRIKLIPELERITTSYKEYEMEILENITKLRQKIDELKNDKVNLEKLNDIQLSFDKISRNIYLNAENYPDLKASNIYKNLMNNWKISQENVTASISVYNQSVQIFNDKLMMFPSTIINKILLKKQLLKTFDDPSIDIDIMYKPNFS